MELLTKKQFDTLLVNGKATAEAQANGKDEPDHFPVVKLFNPCGAATWLLSEIDPQYPDIAFGLCDLGMDCAELGNVSLNELRSIRLPFGLGIERDLHWTATHSLIVYARAAWKVGGIVLDRASLDAAAKDGAG